MAKTIGFYFDFSSGYAYFAAHAIDEIAERHGYGVTWRPYMLGVAFKATGARGLSSTPLKGDYARHDWARLARSTGLRFAIPDGHPIVALPASRAYYWIEANHPEQAHEFARRAFRAYFADGVDMTRADNVVAVAAELGVPGEALLAGIGSEPMKQRVKDVSAQALARGVFGSPYFLVGDEPFWGWDRLSMLEEWIASGGW